MAQKCSWVKRVHSKAIDNWRVNLKLGCPDFNVELLRKVDFCPIRNPILYGIAEAFELFVNCFTEIGNNYKVVPIFNNRYFRRTKVDNRLLDIEFFGKSFYKANRNAIRKLTFNDCFVDNKFRSIAQFESINLPLNWNTWMRLQCSILFAKNSLAKEIPPSETDPAPQSINQFFARFRKGSKPFRNIIDRSVYQKSCITKLPVLGSFCEIVKLTIPPPIISKNFESGWNCNFLDNNIREFIFKCRNNLLGTGDRLSNFLPNINDTCFLCKNLTQGKDCRETFLHLFRNCSVTSKILYRFNTRFKLAWTDNASDFNKLYWFGELNGQLEKQVLLVYDLFRYSIWCMKQRRAIDMDLVIDNTVCMLRTVFYLKPSIKTTFRNNNRLANILEATG
jgi:hypothetical protein